MKPSCATTNVLARTRRLERGVIALAWALSLSLSGLTGVPSAAAQTALPRETRGAATSDPNAAVRGEVVVVLASEAEGMVDPSLADIPALRQPPFNSFHSMSVLARNTAQLSSEHPMEVDLPNGRRLRIELERALPDGRYRVRISINTPGQTDYLSLLQVLASPGDPFFVAGQNWQRGTLVIGVRIGQRPATR